MFIESHGRIFDTKKLNPLRKTMRRLLEFEIKEILTKYDFIERKELKFENEKLVLSVKIEFS